MKANRENNRKIKTIIHEQIQQILGEFLCLKKNLDSNDDDYIMYPDRVELKFDSNVKWVFYKLNNQWVQLNGATKEDEGKWSCDGSDNFFIIAGNKRYSSKSDWEPINPVFNCLLFGHSGRNMEYSFSENEFKVPYKSSGAHYVFYKDYKWSNIQTQTGTVLNSGTWKCDGDDEFEIISPKATFSSKKGWTKL